MKETYYPCPFCEAVIPICEDAARDYAVSFNACSGRKQYEADYDEDHAVIIKLYHCPKCHNVTIVAQGYCSKLASLNVPIYPQYAYIHFPEYIPAQIREDYEEACAIRFASPKASATLARRCLQGMIRDFWQITRNTLKEEIDAIKDCVMPDLWEGIDAVRRIGNIGAHMEKDVNVIVDIEPGEANYLLQLIELLMKEWYIARQQRQELFTSIKDIDNDKKQQRKATAK